MYTDKTFWAGVSRYPLLGRDEADSFDLRGGTIRAIYMRKISSSSSITHEHHRINGTFRLK